MIARLPRDHYRPLHQLRMLEQERDDRLLLDVVGGIQLKLLDGTASPSALIRRSQALRT